MERVQIGDCSHAGHELWGTKVYMGVGSKGDFDIHSIQVDKKSKKVGGVYET